MRAWQYTLDESLSNSCTVEEFETLWSYSLVLRATQSIAPWLKAPFLHHTTPIPSGDGYI